jgi:3',5'-cyclic-nucleotide phosphodiesterase
MRPSGGRRQQFQLPTLISQKSSQLSDPKQPHFLVGSDPHQTNLQSSRSPKSHILPPRPEPDPYDSRPRVRTSSRARIHFQFVAANLPPTDAIMDHFLELLTTLPHNLAVESFFGGYFRATTANFWLNVPDLQLLYNQRLGHKIAYSSGLVGYCLYARAVVRAASGPLHPSYHAQADESYVPLDAPVVIFPLCNYKGDTVGVVEIVRAVHGPEFSQADEDFILWFSKKYRLLSRWLQSPPSFESLALDFFRLRHLDQFCRECFPRFQQFFNVRRFEIWRMEDARVERFTLGKCEVITAKSLGIVGSTLNGKEAVNCEVNRLHSSYSPRIDGLVNEAVLSIPVIEQNSGLVYAVVLRGPKSNTLFTPDDVALLQKLAGLILLGMSNADSFTKMESEYNAEKAEKKDLAALLEVVEILSSQLENEKVCEVIMDKGRTLTNADRCSLFIVNESHDRLTTYLHQGLDTPIDIPINRGIAGRTISGGAIQNISDAYSVNFFDQSIDIETGYRTESILSVPIFNSHAEVIGVTQMINKLSGGPFTPWDSQVIQTFNVFAGVALENSRMYRESVEMTNQLKSFVNIAFSISKEQSVQRMLSVIMKGARASINADRASIFLVDEIADCLSTFIADGGQLPPTISLSIGLAAQCAKAKEGLCANDPYSSPYFNKTIDLATGYRTTSLLAAPIIASNGTVLGVVEMVNKLSGDFGSRDLHLLMTFAQFASIALEHTRLKDLAHLGDIELELTKWIGETEREAHEIPKNLRLSDEQQSEVLSLNCFAEDYRGIGHFKELFYFFSRFRFFDTFSITNERFFRFIFDVSGRYKQVPYHNWTHACDVVQYVVYEITTARLDDVFTSLELFALVTAAICHDVNHEGFNNIFNVKAQTPYGILFKDMSVMEMHHITQSIPIITNDAINLFKVLTPDQTKKTWTLFITLILATDMARHFDLVKLGNQIVDSGEWNMEDPEHRILAMKCILKVADISNVSRPFDIASKWCDILCDEFFRQGDIEKETGIGLTSPLNDREHVDKPKSQIGFYNFICLPLYGLTAKIFPPLQVNADSVRSNLDVWKSIAAQS